MKVVSIKDIEGTERDVHCPHKGFRSLRIVLERDGVGFSMHKTIIPCGDTQHWHYTRHMEVCYCIAGHGELRNLKTAEPYFIEADTAYILDSHDDHTFTAFDEVVLISVFNPALRGTETHREDGSYD